MIGGYRSYAEPASSRQPEDAGFVVMAVDHINALAPDDLPNTLNSETVKKATAVDGEGRQAGFLRLFQQLEMRVLCIVDADDMVLAAQVGQFTT
jgi:hypothetical protein